MDGFITVSASGRTVTLDANDRHLVKGRSVYLDGKGYPSVWSGGRNLRLHRLVAGIACKDDEVDHRDRDPLNCRRSNLRVCTRAENMRNRGIRSTNSSGFKGVSWSKQLGRWRAYTSINRKQISLGLFDDPKEAARAHDIGVVKQHGEFAVTNASLGLL